MLRNMAVRWLEVRPSLRWPTRWRISSSFVRPGTVQGIPGQAVVMGDGPNPFSAKAHSGGRRDAGNKSAGSRPAFVRALERIGARKSRLTRRAEGDRRSKLV